MTTYLYRAVCTEHVDDATTTEPIYWPGSILGRQSGYLSRSSAVDAGMRAGVAFEIIRSQPVVFLAEMEVDPEQLEPIDYASLALRLAQGQGQGAVNLDLEHPVLDRLHVDHDVRAVVELHPQRGAVSDGEGSHVPVLGTDKSDDVELESGTAEALEDRVEVNKRVVVYVDVEVRPVVKFAHPQIVGGA